MADISAALKAMENGNGHHVYTLFSLCLWSS
jgi:hypothetical protein